MKIISLSIGLIAAILLSSLACAGPLVYVATNQADEILVIDSNTDTILRHIKGPISPHGVATTPDGRHIVVGSLHKDKDTAGNPVSQLTVLSTGEGKTEQVIPMMNWSSDNIVTRNGNSVISIHPNEGRVCVVDLGASKIITTLDIGKTANHVVLGRDGRYAYVSSGGSDSIVEIDTMDWTIKRRMAGGPTPGQMALSPDGKLIYAISFRTDELSFISVEYGAVVRTLHLGMGLRGIDRGADGRLYVSGRNGNRFYVVTPATADVKSLSLPVEPNEVKAVTGTDKVYVTAHASPKLLVIDSKTMKLAKEIYLTGIGHQMVVAE